MVSGIPSASAEKRLKISAGKIPPALVREVIDGIPFFYAGFREVLNKTKTIEEIMSDSGLQSILKELIGDLLTENLGRKNWWILRGEVGNHADRRDNMGLDVAVFDKKTLPPEKITTKFIDVPAVLVVEVDVNVELPDPKSDLFEEYVVRKIRRLFKFGTKQVVWIFTKSKMVISARSTARQWQVSGWEDDVELLNGIQMNVKTMLENEGINPDVFSKKR